MVFANIPYISSVFNFFSICRLLLPTLPTVSIYFTITPSSGNDGGCVLGSVYIFHTLSLPFLYIYIPRVFLIYINHHL